MTEDNVETRFICKNKFRCISLKYVFYKIYVLKTLYMCGHTRTHTHAHVHICTPKPVIWDKVQTLQFGIQCFQNVSQFLQSYQLLLLYSHEGADTESITEPWIYCDFILSEYISSMRYIRIHWLSVLIHNNCVDLEDVKK